MFTIGRLVDVTVLEGKSEHTYENCKILQFNDGLLKVRHPDGKEVTYNMRSRSFIKASEQT